ncbi:hypothetical protein SOVF_171220 [Spinacia oleracea]|nr:hypothetical protein SOVF_171220 [Spinacia oleracea]
MLLCLRKMFLHITRAIEQYPCGPACLSWLYLSYFLNHLSFPVVLEQHCAKGVIENCYRRFSVW